MFRVAKWFETLGFYADEATLGDNSSIKPGVTTAIPGKAHLSFNLDRHGRPFDIIKVWKRWE